MIQRFLQGTDHICSGDFDIARSGHVYPLYAEMAGWLSLTSPAVSLFPEDIHAPRWSMWALLLNGFHVLSSASVPREGTTGDEEKVKERKKEGKKKYLCVWIRYLANCTADFCWPTLRAVNA